jgi:hypothetical protein
VRVERLRYVLCNLKKQIKFHIYVSIMLVHLYLRKFVQKINVLIYNGCTCALVRKKPR